MAKKDSHIITIALAVVAVVIIAIIISYSSQLMSTKGANENNATFTPEPSHSVIEPSTTPIYWTRPTLTTMPATPIPTTMQTSTPTPTASRAPPSSTSQILCLGDSITFGFGISKPYPDVLQSLTGNTTANEGTPGAQTPTIRSIYDNSKTYANFTALVTLGGINDITFNLPSANIEATIESNLQYIWQDAQSRGMRVYALTLTPFGGYNAYNNETQAELINVNAWIRSVAPTLGVKVIDTNSALADPANPDYMQLSYDSGDHIHPNQAGADVIASLVAAVLLTG